MLGAKLKTGAAAAFGVAAFAAGWAGGHVSGIRRALRLVGTLRRSAECRAHEDGCRWVYPPGHPGEGEPFGERPDGELHFVEREVVRHRPFAGLPLLETLEFDAAEGLARRPSPPDLPPWWEWPTKGPGAGEFRERKRREDERVRRQRAFLRRLRRRLFGGLRLRARGRLGPSAGGDRSLRVEVENTALVAVEARQLRLTYAYQEPLIERLFGRAAPRTPLADLLAGEGGLPRRVGPGETLRWSAQMREVKGRLDEAGMSHWPDARLMRMNDPLSGRLARRGGLGLRAVNLLRGLTFRRLAVELVDGGGGGLKAEVRFAPHWEE